VRFRAGRFVVGPLAGPARSLVWAIASLTFTARAQPRVRSFGSF
jgi:phage terminase large subunit-like protein